MNVYPRPNWSHLRREFLRRCGFHCGFLLAIALTLTACLLGVAHGQEKEIVTYGPWKGYWQQARLSAYSPHDELDKAYHATKGERWRWICADGKTDVRTEPYGLAASGSLRFGTRVFIPRGHGYLDTARASPHERVFVVSDRGGYLDRIHATTGRLSIDVRYRTEFSALAFGIKDAWVFIIVD